MTISVYAHIHPSTETAITIRDGDAGRHAVLCAGDLAVFVGDREKLLEIALLLERAAQQWGDEE